MSRRIDGDREDREGLNSGHLGVEALSDYIDNTLPPRARKETRLHLASCADCRADYVELSAARRLLRSMPQVAPPRSFTLTREMARAARPPRLDWLQRLLVPQNASRFATGSAVSFVLLFLVFLSGVFVGGKVNNAFTRISSGLSDGSAGISSSAEAPGAGNIATGSASAATPLVKSAPGGAEVGGLYPTPVPPEAGGIGALGEATSMPAPPMATATAAPLMATAAAAAAAPTGTPAASSDTGTTASGAQEAPTASAARSPTPSLPAPSISSGQTTGPTTVASGAGASADAARQSTVRPQPAGSSPEPPISVLALVEIGLVVLGLLLGAASLAARRGAG